MSWCCLPLRVESILYFMCRCCESIRMVNVNLHLHLLCCLMVKKNAKFSKCWLIGSVPLAGIASISLSILCLGKAWGLSIVNGNTKVI